MHGEALSRAPAARTVARLLTIGRDNLSKSETVSGYYEDRMSEIGERSSPARAPSFTASPKREPEKFDNDALKNLFTPLLDR